jgi:hypothetical protein
LPMCVQCSAQFTRMMLRRDDRYQHDANI